MAVRPYLRSSLARTLYNKMSMDEILRNYDKSKWYDMDLDKVDCELRDLYFQSHADEETEKFLDNCFEKSDWVFTQILHSLFRSVLGWFMTRTSINGYLGRGSMFVFSNAQLQGLLQDFSHKMESWKTDGNLLDLGAGDGKVTDILSQHFSSTYVTEISGVMQKILKSKKYKVLDVEKWHLPDTGPEYYDVISCLNLLDRCNNPITILQQIRQRLKPETGLLILALVLPVKQYVEVGSKYHVPSEKIPVSGVSFEEQISSLSKQFTTNGFRVVRFTKLPYLSEGDLDRAFYWLNDVVFVLQVDDICTSTQS